MANEPYIWRIATPQQYGEFSSCIDLMQVMRTLHMMHSYSYVGMIIHQCHAHD
jgi:hypothetical protein